MELGVKVITPDTSWEGGGGGGGTQTHAGDTSGGNGSLLGWGRDACWGIVLGKMGVTHLASPRPGGRLMLGSLGVRGCVHA